MSDNGNNTPLKTERQKMTDGEHYNPLDPELVADRLRARSILHQFNHSADPLFREELLRGLLRKAGERLMIEPSFHCDYGYNIAVGDRVYCNVGCVFLDGCPITLGDDVLLGPGVQLYTADHPLEPELRLAGVECGAPIAIENGVWIGGQAIVLPGVTIGEGSVIGAGSVVTKNIPPGVVAVGTPARVIKKL